MSKVRKESQYLVECDKDGSFCILFKRSLIYGSSAELHVGENVTFLWPEDSDNQNTYYGKIIKVSSDEDELVNLMNEMSSNTKNKNIKTTKKIQQEKKGKREKKITRCEEIVEKESNSESCAESDKDEPENSKSTEKVLRNQIRNAVNLDIFSKLGMKIQSQIPSPKSSTSCTQVQPQPSTSKSDASANEESNMDWISEQLSSMESEIDRSMASHASTLISLQSLSNKVDFLKSMINCTGNERKNVSTKENHQKRRSHNMPLDDESQNFALKKCTKKNYKTIEQNLKMIDNVNRRSRNMPSVNKTVKGKSTEKLQLEDPDFESLPSSPKKEKIEEAGDSETSSTSSPVRFVEVVSKSESRNGEKSNTMLPSTMDHEGKWTLKYTRLDDETQLRELIKNSRIYVSESELINAKRTVTKQTVLARILMTLVFTPKALAQCTLFGKPLGESGSSTDRKPGLFKPGVETILRYVENHASRKKWKEVDSRLIKASMSQKLVEISNTKSANQ